jgi:hypothetical protein
VLSIGAHLNGYQVGRKIDAGGIQPVQSFQQEKLLAFARKQLQLAEKVYAVYEAGPLGYVLTASSRSWGSRRWSASPNAWKPAI